MNTNLEYQIINKNRENMYRFLGCIYRKEVDQSLLTKLLAMTFPNECSDTQLNEGYHMLNAYLVNSNSDMLTDLAVDYAKIFLAAGSAQGLGAFPYESVYTSRKKIIMQDAWEQVCKIYAVKGIGKSEETNELHEDHIALELEYMAYLCQDIKSGSKRVLSLEEQKEFLEKHLLNWTSEFCIDIEKYAETDFYKGIAKITNGFLQMELAVIESLIKSRVSDCSSSVSYSVSTEKMDKILAQLKNEYKIYAPKRFSNRGYNADLIRYDEINSVKEIVYDEKSDFSPKDVFYPVSQTMFYFKQEECVQSNIEDEKGILIFARPCDINGIKRLDTIFLKNGEVEDVYYKRLREKLKIIMLECQEDQEDCFCVSMGANITDNYNMAVRFDEDSLQVEVKDEELNKYFHKELISDFSPKFVQSNVKKIKIPKIENKEILKKAATLDFWESYNETCIGCGGCNTVCITCSCFDTVDIIYNETSHDGERKRVWSSCMLDSFTMMAGGGRTRKTAGANMRFKTLHKVYDYNARFGGEEHMCVGCGRCVKRCSQNISFIETLNRLNEELEKLTIDEKWDGEVISNE